MAATAPSKKSALSSALRASASARSRRSHYASCATRIWARSCAATWTDSRRQNAAGGQGCTIAGDVDKEELRAANRKAEFGSQLFFVILRAIANCRLLS